MARLWNLYSAKNFSYQQSLAQHLRGAVENKNTAKKWPTRNHTNEFKNEFAHQGWWAEIMTKVKSLPPWQSCREISRRQLCQRNTLGSTWLLLSFWRERRKTRRVFASGATTRRICRTSKMVGSGVITGTTAHAYKTRGALACRKWANCPNYLKRTFSTFQRTANTWNLQHSNQWGYSV